MTFQEWFNSAPHRTKYSTDHPAYLAAQEAWETAHEARAKVCETHAPTTTPTYVSYAATIRARGQTP